MGIVAVFVGGGLLYTAAGRPTMKNLFLSGLLFCVLAEAARDIPFIAAHEIVSTEVDPDGKTIREIRETAVQMRSRDGSTWFKVDGADEADLFVAPELAAYTVSQGKRVAVRRVLGGPGLEQRAMTPEDVARLV
jgi:hypothetical protein